MPCASLFSLLPLSHCVCLSLSLSLSSISPRLLSKGMEDWGCHQDGFGFEVSRIPELMSECFVLQQWYGGHFA